MADVVWWGSVISRWALSLPQRLKVSSSAHSSSFSCILLPCLHLRFYAIKTLLMARCLYSNAQWWIHYHCPLQSSGMQSCGHTGSFTFVRFHLSEKVLPCVFGCILIWDSHAGLLRWMDKTKFVYCQIYLRINCYHLLYTAGAWHVPVSTGKGFSFNDIMSLMNKCWEFWSASNNFSGRSSYWMFILVIVFLIDNSFSSWNNLVC